MRNLLTKIGIKIEDPSSELKVHETIAQIMEIYDQCRKDIVLTDVAYGCAVGGISLALNVNLRTATLLFEHALTLRRRKNVYR